MYTTEQDKLILQNNRLKVELAQPGIFYNGARFDHNGFITGVTLDARHTFCVPESPVKGEGSGGCGLCGEFGIDEAIGYEETKVGGYFLKIGVGLLKKPDDKPYNFFHNYKFTPQLSSIAFEEDSFSFTAQAENCNGYAYRYQKNVAICDNRLKISYTLENTGSKRITTTEYCHNFLGIDKRPVDSSYQLTIPNLQELSLEAGYVCSHDGFITWPDEPMEKQFYCLPKATQGDGCSWRLVNNMAGVGVSETDDFTACKLALWGYRHVISPEVFVRVDVEPGQTQQWSREYEFFYL